MFYVKMMTKTIQLSPSYLNPHLERYLDEQLSEEVEGKCLGQEGYIIAVIETVDRGRARVIEGLGGAEFKMKYRAIVYRPFRGEVVDGIVASVNKMGFFVEVGPLSCFVSTHLIPPDYSFDPNANPPCFSSSEDPLRIEKGANVRLKIVGTRIDATEIFAIGTIKEDYLGCFQ